MRTLLLATVVLGALAEFFSATPADARDFPFCIKGQDYPSGTGDCNYPSYAACMAAASGTFSYCARNPFYANAYIETPPRQSRRGSIGQGY